MEYSLRVAIDSGTRFSSDIQVTLPIRIVGFHSIDPPLSQPINVQSVASRPPFARYNSQNDTLNRPYSLSHLRKGEEIANQISTEQKTKMEDDNIFLHDSHDTPHGQDTQELFSDCSGEMSTLELGNLSLADDTDDVVQHAIATARMNSTYGHFSDLYYLQDKIETDGASCDDRWEHSIDDLVSGSPVEAAETSMQEIKPESYPDMSVYDVEVTRALEVHRRSSFAARVEEKTRMATTAFVNGYSNLHIHQERGDVLENGKENDRNLTLKISPILGGEIGQSSRDLPLALNTQFDGFKGTPVNPLNDENSCNAPTQSDHLRSPATMIASYKRHRKAPTIDSSASATLSQMNICPPLVPLAYQGQSKSMTKMSAPICSHCAMHMSDSLTPRGTSSNKNSCRQDAPIFETKNSDDGIWPCIDYPAIGIAKLATVSTTALVSPTSTTSTTSATSAASVSVKDKVRRLEERVKTSTSLLT